MRVIAGVAKGRRLASPSGAGVRPTADRVREALFASLQGVVVDAHVLDLYAGSGALGFEALSRGAADVTFVERDRVALEVLRRNHRTVDLPGARVVARSVAAALVGPLAGAPFDLVLADPPYRLAEPELATVLEEVVAHLRPGALVVVERSARTDAPTWPLPLQPLSARRYGDTALHRARYEPEEPARGQESSR